MHKAMLFFLCDQGVRAKLFPPWLLDDDSRASSACVERLQDEFFLV